MPLATAGLTCLLAALGLLIGCGQDGQPAPEPRPQVLLGAHYYTWYSTQPVRHWNGGIWRQPRLGQYDSGNPPIAAQHIAWAADAGIDVLAVDWVNPGYAEEALDTGLLRAENLDRIRFCLFYDIANRAPAFGQSDPFHIVFDPRLRTGVVSDLERLGRKYFGHPRYYRIGGKPVVWMYLSRNYEGAWLEALAEARSRMPEPVYLLADEVWFGDPQAARIAAFDGIGSYNLYDPDRMVQRPSWTLAQFDALIGPVQQRWQPAIAPKALFPVVLPGYDDRQVAGRSNPPVQPATAAEVQQSYAAAQQLALRNANPEERVVWLTSFNEWHEGTAIEPDTLGAERLEAVRDAFGP